MTTILFQESIEAEETPQPAQVPLATRLLYCTAASLVAIVPAVGATFSAFQVARFFRAATDRESVRAARVLAHLSVVNTPLIIALGVSALLAFWIALAFATDDKRRLASAGLPFSICVPILGATPALFLWWAETTIVEVISGKYNGAAVGATAQTISNLLLLALTSGLIVPCAVFVCAVVSLCIPVRTRIQAFSSPRAFVWGPVGMLLLIFAGAYLVLI